MDPSHPFVSIVVLNYNGSKLGGIFRECISSLLATNYHPFEVVIADNGSEDDSTKQAVEEHKSGAIRALMLGRNMGTARGNNAAFLKGSLKGELIVFVNSDVVVSPDWLAKIVDAMVLDRRLAACGPVVKEQGLMIAGGFCTLGGAVYQLNSLPSNLPYYVNYATGSCLMVRASVFRMLGGFNPHFFMYYDETDLCARMRAIGYEVGCVPSASVLHYGSQTVKATGSSWVYFYMARNRFFYLYQNRRARDLLLAVPVAILASLKDVIFLLQKHSPSAFRMAVRGSVAGFFSMNAGLSAHGRRPFKDSLAISLLADFLYLLPARFSYRYLQRMMTEKVRSYAHIEPSPT